MTTTRTRHGPETRQRAIELQTQGVPRAKIAEQLGIKLGALHKIFRTSGTKVTKEQHDANRKVARRANMPEYAPDLTENILRLRKETSLTRQEIADKLGVSIDKVHSDIQSHAKGDHISAIQRSDVHRHYPKEVRDDVVKARKAGEDVQSIGERFAIPTATVQYFCAEAGVTLTKEQVAANIAKALRAPKARRPEPML